MKNNYKNIVAGTKFDRLITIGEPFYTYFTGSKICFRRKIWHVVTKCKCGRINISNIRRLIIRKTKSCGCLHNEWIKNPCKNFPTTEHFNYVEICIKDKCLLVDKDVFDKIKNHAIHISQDDYPIIVINNKNYILSRIISNAKKNDQVDHINLNKLDNRKENLRLVTNQQNQTNTLSRGGTSKYKGVVKEKNKWKARITVHNKCKSLGRFSIEEEAAKAYDVAARKYFKQHGRYNFPETGEFSAI